MNTNDFLSPEAQPTLTSQPVMHIVPDYNPFNRQYKVHPLKAEVEKKALDFMERYRLYWTEEQRQRLYGQDCGGIAGYVYTLAPNAEQLQLGADLAMIAFTWDDEFCDEGPTRDKPMEMADSAFRTIRALECHDIIVDKNDRYAVAMRDILQRVRQLSPDYLANQWVDSVRHWFFIEIQKASNVARGIRPNLSDYVVTRMHTGATPTFMLNTQIANGLELGPGLLFDRRVNALMELARTVVNWSSDCYSYFKEAERTADGYNIIDVLMDTHNLSVEAAMAMAFNMQDRMLMRFVELRDEVLNGPHDKGAEIYIDALEEYTIGGILWCQQTQRYRFIDGTTSGRLAYTASGFTRQARGSELSEPIDIPTIAWWWQVGERADQHGRR
ncbi:Terpene synthase family, metal binding domain [Serratia plymuthica]|uniref:sodorifen biosynthesis terpene cyclase SodD n=1 Tax=Serratia TaxID=613 RepID=UPI00020E99B0|nr:MULTISPECIES: sodorifen biosynthesis terpene cyclase SodD [Serratia]AEF45325.1 hypothetical protein SerAS9_2199 [Serratia plymuthica AS9]AEF50276.1 hypothetical protein SerAS12_2199 [Serratia sp. AS12]AEG27983.1 hypothetical protein SerAS13_2200 [Serratia sp. AS13]MBJ7893872.1 terpene cyclase [Serratia sp. PAMC26656]UTN98801.1 terpene cyclase [Serratia plymuthica]